MENIEYKIYKYEQTPVPNPDSNIIGFLITNTDSGKYNNIEYTLTFSETNNMSEEEICQMAFTKLKPQIDAIVEKLKSSNNSVIGKVFLPSN
jgi:hypothetical protein